MNRIVRLNDKVVEVMKPYKSCVECRNKGRKFCKKNKNRCDDDKNEIIRNINTNSGTVMSKNILITQVLNYQNKDLSGLFILKNVKD